MQPRPTLADVVPFYVSCGDGRNIEQRLADAYRETRQIQGLSDRGPILEVFGSESGTYTVVYRFPNGTACVVDSGNSLQIVPQEHGRPS